MQDCICITTINLNQQIFELLRWISYLYGEVSIFFCSELKYFDSKINHISDLSRIWSDVGGVSEKEKKIGSFTVIQFKKSSKTQILG